MTSSSETLHENSEDLTPEIIDRHRATVSLMEELEAVNWYDQRASACTDDELRAILEHNREEEKEHAVMVLEWLRRHDAELDAQLRGRLFRAGPIAVEEHEPGGPPAAVGTEDTDPSLGIGSLKQRGGGGEA